MGTNAILLHYQSRLIALHAAASQSRIGQVIAIAILGSAIVGILVLAFFFFAKRALPLPIALVPLSLAICAARSYKSRGSALLRTLRLQTLYEKGTARLEGSWVGLGEAGEEFVPQGHSYGSDLNVFGEGSLYELLCTCRTEVGRRSLANYLLQSPPLPEARRRQEAVKELQTNTALREEVNLLGDSQFQQASWNTITEWLDSPFLSDRSLFPAITFVTSTSLTLLVLLSWDQVIAWSTLISWICGLLLVNGALGALYRKRVSASLGAIRSVGLELKVLRQGLKLMQGRSLVLPCWRIWLRLREAAIHRRSFVN